MKITTARIMAAILALCSGFCLAQEPSPWEFLSQRGKSLALQENGLGGPGAEFLISEAEAAQFFLIGENHGIAEVPRFTGALFKAVQPMGFDHLVIETGPHSASVLSHLARQENPVEAFEALFRDFPFSIPFYGLREEADLIQTVVRSSSHPVRALWGIDQEFILAPQLFLDRLADRVADAELAARCRSLADAEKEALARINQTKRVDPSGFAMYQVESPLKQLAADLRAKGFDWQADMVHDLDISGEVYRLWLSGKGFENNAQRALLNKKHFMAAYHEAEKALKQPPRAVVKMGSNHIAKGHTPMNILDVGNTLAELAAMNGKASFHLLVLVASGTQNIYVPFRGDEAKRAPIQGGPAAMKAFVENLRPRTWTVYDLRPLRAQLARWGEEYSELKRLALGYDSVLLIPEGHAAALME